MTEKRIGDLTYRCKKLAAFDTIKLGRRLGNLLGPAVSQIVTAFRTADEAEREGAVVAAIAAVSVTLDERAENLIKELAEMCQVNWDGVWHDVRVDQDEFVQSPAVLMQIVGFSLETNMKSFTQGLRVPK